MTFSEKFFKEKIAPELKGEFKFKNYFEIPKITKMVINCGIGRLVKESKDNLDIISADIIKISGQKPQVIKSNKAISGFKLKPGDIVGLKVTLRGQRMYDFLEKLIRITFPRIRDFRGLKKSVVDKNGNINIGIKEHTVFPEIKIEEVKKVFSLQVSISTTAKNQDQGIALLKTYGAVFEKEAKNN
jgi:large subunit ribosomal protein L5